MNIKKLSVNLLVLSVVLFISSDGFCGKDYSKKLEQAESRLSGIYEKGEYRVERFGGEWLPDSSGYTLMENVNGARVKAFYSVPDGERTKLDEKIKDTRKSDKISPDGKLEIYSGNGNLYVRNLVSKESVQITKAGPDNAVSYSQMSWSPDGKHIVFVESDYSNVKQRVVLDHSDPSYPKVNKVRFARVGETIPTLRVGIADAQGKEIRWLAISQPAEGFYLRHVGWACNSKEVVVEKLRRFRDERWFLLADINNGKIKEIFHESDPAWVVASYAKNAGIRWIDGGKKFIVISEKDGWRHAWLYSRSGKELELLTPGKFDIIEASIIDEANGIFYFYASPHNGTQRYLYRAKLDGSGKPIRVTPKGQPGWHEYDFSPDAKWAFHTCSSFEKPPVTTLVRISDHKTLRVLENNAKLCEKMKSFGNISSEFVRIKIDGGIEMDSFIVKPDGFDPSKKYPVFIYVYGEPHGQTVFDRWSTRHLFHRTISEMGYLMVSIDNQGTPAPKGAAWRRSIFGSLGPLSTEQQAAGIKELGRMKSYVDLSRVGIWGWSGGGSNTLNAMFRKPDVYNFGIAVAPKPQPWLYNAWFQEIYMETPETNPEGYRKSAPINFAEGLAGDLLIIHGTGETNTHLEITEGLVDKLIKLGKQFDYMTYPGRDHGIRKGEGTSVHLRTLMCRYLLDHLAPGPK